jgi:hypothetical protein
MTFKEEKELNFIHIVNAIIIIKEILDNNKIN